MQRGVCAWGGGQLQCELDGHSEGERRNERDADESERSESRAPPRHGETDRQETQDEAPRAEREGWKEESGARAVLPSACQEMSGRVGGGMVMAAVGRTD